MTRRGWGWKRLPLLAGAALLACGSGGPGATSSGGGSSSSGGSSGTSSGGPGGAASPLIGTWDVISAIGGRERTATITVGATSLLIEWDGFELNADVSAGVEITATHEGISTDVKSTHIEEPADFGQIPYRLGGSWSFRGRDADQCTATIKTDSAQIACSNLARPISELLHEFDYVAKKPLGTGTSTAQRKRKLESIFGELGGEWAVVTPRASCTVTFEANRFTADCTQERAIAVNRRGTMTLTFDDGLVSGTSNAGELSARRR